MNLQISDNIIALFYALFIVFGCFWGIFGGQSILRTGDSEIRDKGYNAELVGNGDAIDIIDVIGGYK